MDDLGTLNLIAWNTITGPVQQVPAFYRTQINITSTPNHTFLLTKGWGHGFVMINGINIGRFSMLGPQCTLYVPASVLVTGMNLIIIFESDAPPSVVGKTGYRNMTFTDQQLWLSPSSNELVENLIT